MHTESKYCNPKQKESDLNALKGKIFQAIRIHSEGAFKGHILIKMYLKIYQS